MTTAKRNFRFLVLLFTVLCAFTSTASAQLLWEIKGKKVKKSSFLYGTIHISDKRVFDFKPGVMKSFEQCNLMAGELDLSQNNQMMIFKILPLMMMPGDTTLESLYSPEEYEFVKKAIRERLLKNMSKVKDSQEDTSQGQSMMGMFDMMINRIKPMFISLMFSDNSVGSLDQLQREPPLDLYFQQKAGQKDMRVIGLETIEEQMNVFNSVPLQEQARGLYEELKNEPKEKGQSPLNNLIELYLSEDIERLYQVTTAELPDYLVESLLRVRNKNMVSRMARLMKKNRMFVAVGAAHLGGEEGIIALLRKQGYKVEPVQ